MDGRENMSSRLAIALRKIRAEHGVPLLLSLLISAIFVCIELSHPYFFFQDDNRNQNLPYYLHNLRALLAGEIPLFNFHQSLGTPMLACIQSAAFYPINYLALGLSRLFLGHYYGAMEFIALIHLLAAGLGFFYFMRFFRLSPASCFFGAIAWPLCGFVMTAGNSWIQVVGYAAFLPWILLFSARLINEFRWKYFWILAALRLFDLLLGYPPFFAYTVFFDLMTACLLYPAIRHSGETAGRFPHSFKGFALMHGGNYLVAMIFGLPLLLPAFHQISISADRSAALPWNDYIRISTDLHHWINGLVTPFSSMPVNFWNDQHFISHIGYLPLLFAGVAVLYWNNREKRKIIGAFALLAAISFLWATGTLIPRIFYYVPIYDRLRWPFKVSFFTSFYLIVIATFGFNLLTDRLALLEKRWGRSVKTIVPIVMTAHLANFLLLYALLPQHMFSVQLDAVPFDEPLKETLADGRIVSLGLPTVMAGQKRIYGHAVPQLGFNYPTLFGLYGFGGYELLLAKKNVQATLGLRGRSAIIVDDGPLDLEKLPALEQFRGWGVKWYVIDSAIQIASLDGFKLAYRDGNRTIVHDALAKDFAYWVDTSSSQGIQWKFSTNSLSLVTNRDTAGPLQLNLLYNPFFSARIDGGATDIRETPHGQIALLVPAGRHEVVLSYSDPYFLWGVAISGCAALAAGLLVLFSWRRRGPPLARLEEPVHLAAHL